MAKRTTWFRSLVSAGLVTLATALPIKAEEITNESQCLSPFNIEQRITYEENSGNFLSETRSANDFYSGILVLSEDNKKIGGELQLSNSSLNLCYENNFGLDKTRLNLETKSGDWLFGAGHQTKEGDGKQDLIKGYLTRNFGESKLELGVNNNPRIVSTYRTPLNKDNAVILTAELGEQRYWRTGVGIGHSGVIGFLAYAHVGENSDGTSYTDLRIRGGLGNKQGKGSISFLSLRDSGISEYNLIDDPTCVLTTGPFDNFNASLRGDPFGFDIRYKNGTYSSEIAGMLGRFTLMTKFEYNKDTKESSLNLELHFDFGKNFSARLQNTARSDRKPSQAIMLGYQTNF